MTLIYARIFSFSLHENCWNFKVQISWSQKIFLFIRKWIMCVKLSFLNRCDILVTQQAWTGFFRILLIYGLMITKKHFSAENLSFRRLYQLHRVSFFYKGGRTKQNLFSCCIEITAVKKTNKVSNRAGVSNQNSASHRGEVGKHLENARKAVRCTISCRVKFVRCTISCRISSSTQHCRFYREFSH